MDSKAIRTVVIMGIVTVFALTLLMMFSLNQLADTQTPQMAIDLSRELQRSLAADPPASVKITMVRDGKGVNAPRTYNLRIRPNEAVASDERALQRLMYRASELCAAQLGEMNADVRIRCTADLPQGGEKEANFVKDKPGESVGLALIHAVDVASAQPEAAPVQPRKQKAPKR